MSSFVWPNRRLVPAATFLRTVILSAVAWCAIATCLASAALSLGRDQEPSGSDGAVAELIEQLGADSFSERERARESLEALGVRAFDALYEVRNANDIEVRMSARDLLRRIRVHWIEESDPAAIKAVLRGYSSQTPADRRSRIDQLNRLDITESSLALARVARFERSEILSKRAALVLMSRATPETVAERRLLAESLRQSVGTSRRAASIWIHIYAEGLHDPESTLDRWQQVIDEESSLFQLRPDSGETDRETLRDLARWRGGLLYELGHDELAHEAMIAALGLIDGSAEQILEMVDWLMQRDAYPVVAALVDRFPRTFERDSLLLYHVAEMHLRAERETEAMSLAQRASQLLGNEPRLRLEVGGHLHQRGFLGWAEREYRAAIECSPVGDVADVDARMLLSSLLHDQQQHVAAAQVLEELVEALVSDPAIEQSVRRKRSPASISARMHYYFALQLQLQGELDPSRERLVKANTEDPGDADVLIAMYHSPDAAGEWRRETLTRIDNAIGSYHDQMQYFERQMAEIPDGRNRQIAGDVLAAYNNQYAWLIANTEGDLEEAIRCSRRSIELVPDTAGYWDTLARCFFAAGDLPNAVRCQERAVSMEPYAQSMRRRLDSYREELGHSE